MRSLYRIRRLAIANRLGSVPAIAPVLRCLSTSSPQAASSKVDSAFDLSALRRLHKELGERDEPSSQSRWSDDGMRSEGASSEPSSSTSGFFTASRPFARSAPPPSASEQQALETLMPLLHLHPDQRDEALCTRIWRTYHQMSPSTRRSLNPTILRMVMRAVVPSRAEQTEFKRRVQDPVRAFATQAAKLERRLQVVVADMIRSTWVDQADKQIVPAPSSSDYLYAMSTLSNLGATEACEAIYRELKSADQTAANHAKCLRYRLRALKIWMTERIHLSTFTVNRPTMAQSSPIARSLRWRPDKQESDPATFAVKVLWDVLRELGNSTFSTNQGVYKELVVTLRRILQFLPDTEMTASTTLRKLLQQVLEKGYGIDFRFLRQDPAYESTSIRPRILDAVMYLMGSQGDVWRMTAMYEALTDMEAVRDAVASEIMEEVEEDDVGETLSAALAAEAALGQSRDWLGRTRAASPEASAEASTEANTSTRPVRELPPHWELDSTTDPSETRRFEDFIPSISSPILAARDPVTYVDLLLPGADLEGLSPVRTETVTTMLESVQKHGDIELAMHLLRTSLRDAASSRNAWLSRLKQWEARNLNAPTDPRDLVAPTEWATRRALLVSGRWFELVHLVTRTQSGSSWASGALRELMKEEAQAIREEYHILTGMDMEDRTSIPETALIHRVPIPSTSFETGPRVFHPARHLAQLQQSHKEVVKLLSVSLHQVEKRRQWTAAKNARRAEKAAIAAREEAERIEAKKAGRRKREEVVESTLVLA